MSEEHARNMLIILIVGIVMLFSTFIVGTALCWFLPEKVAGIATAVWFFIGLFLIALPGGEAVGDVMGSLIEGFVEHFR